MKKQTRNRVWAGVGVALAGVGFMVLTRAQFAGAVNQLNVDLSRPDVLVRSARLSALPKDLVNAPLLKGVLTDEVVHYYEEHPTRLSLVGTLKRMAYDHSLSWSDQLIAKAIDAPAELSLWRDGKGRPEYFMLVLKQNLATQAAQQLAKVALPDDQLSKAGDLSLPKGKATVWALKVNQRNTWLLVSQEDRMVVLSDPGLLLDEGRQVARNSAQALKALFQEAPTAATPQAKAFGLPPLSGLQQQIVARGDYLSFGYQPFFSGLDAVRVDMHAPANWQMSAKMSLEALRAWQESASHLWQALPRGQALCVALPMDWKLAGQVLANVSTETTLAMLKDLRPVAGTCWNQGGGMDAPMLAAQLKRPARPADDEAIQSLIDNVTRKHPGANSGGDVKATNPPAKVRTVAGVKSWVRPIPHALGNVREGKATVNRVGAARLGPTILAAIDEDSLGQAASLFGKRYPSMADERASQGVPIMVVDSPALAHLIEAETWSTLTPADTPTFHRVARQLLPTRFQALRALGRWQISLPPNPSMGPRVGEPDAVKSGWVSLTVQSLR